jgi:hypothetical protein
MEHVFIISEPRSGSTVLTAMLDRRRGMLSMPESSFPQVLGYLTAEERNDPRRLAAIYLGSTFVPTPLAFEEIVSCMSDDDREVLDQLARATAAKVGRNPADVVYAAWKTVRTIGMHRVIEALDAKVVILRRHPHNVFESQFRFSYGVRNRRPLRYAFFNQSYEKAFSTLRVTHRLEMAYDDLPAALATLTTFIGLPDQGMWPDDSSHFAQVVDQCSWLSEINKEFQNRDPEKRAKLDPALIGRLDLCLGATKPLRPLMGPVRSYFDCRSLGHVREIAARVLEENPVK